MSSDVPNNAHDPDKDAADLMARRYELRFFQIGTGILFGVVALSLALFWDNALSLKLAGGIAAFGLTQVGFIQLLMPKAGDDA